MVVGAEINIFVRVAAELGIGVDGDDLVVHLTVAEVDHVLLAVLTGVQTLRRVKLAAVRRDERDRAHVGTHGAGQIVDRVRVAGDEIVQPRGNFHRAVAHDDHGASVAGVGFLRRVKLRVGLRLLFGLLLRRFGRLRRICRFRRCFGLRFRHCLRLGGRLRLLLRGLAVGFLHGVKRFAALCGRIRLVEDQYAVFAAAGVIIEFIERPVRLQQRFAARECVGIILLQRGDIRSVQQRFDGEFRLTNSRFSDTEPVAS